MASVGWLGFLRDLLCGHHLRAVVHNDSTSFVEKAASGTAFFNALWCLLLFLGSVHSGPAGRFYGVDRNLRVDASVM